MSSPRLGVIGAPRVDLWYRGGRRVRATDLPVTDWEWERVLDGYAEASVTVADPRGLLFDPDDDPVEDWAHELGLSHVGHDDAFIGPVLQSATTIGVGEVKLQARSLSGWWWRRPVLSTINAAGLPLDGGDLLRLLHAAAMAVDPSPRFSVSADLMGIAGVRTYQGTEGPMVGPAVEELSDSLLDWTDYARTVLVRPVQLKATTVLAQDHFVTPPRVVADGAIRCTQVLMRGGSGTTLQVATSAPVYLDRYGLLTRRYSDTKMGDNASVLQAAQSRLALLQDAVYVDTSGSLGLAPSAPITLEELVPGIVFRLDLQNGARGGQFSGDFRLTRVRVSGGTDTVTSVEVDLAPLGDVDTAAGEG